MKPFDLAGATRSLAHAAMPTVITLEEHVGAGGLGGLVKQAAQECGSTSRIVTLHLRDEFVHLYGSQEDLRAAHGITAETVHRALSQ